MSSPVVANVWRFLLMKCPYVSTHCSWNQSTVLLLCSVHGGGGVKISRKSDPHRRLSELPVPATSVVASVVLIPS